MTAFERLRRGALSALCTFRDSVRNRCLLPFGRIVYGSLSDVVLLRDGGRLAFDRGGRLFLSDVHPGRYPGGDRLDVRGTLAVQGRVSLRHGGNRIYVGRGARVLLGDRTFFAGEVEVAALEEIIIGARCAIARRTYITDSDWHTLIIDDEPRPHTIPVSMGDECWLGRDVKVLKGVRLGSGVVAGAGAVVATDVEDCVLVAGVPAKVLRRGIRWDHRRLGRGDGE